MMYVSEVILYRSVSPYLSFYISFVIFGVENDPA